MREWDDEEVAASLARAGVDIRTGGGGTLTSERVLVALGEHRSHFDLFDGNARQLGRVLGAGKGGVYEFRDIARIRRVYSLVDLVVEVDDGASEPLRTVALAASVIADRELINLAGSSSFGP